MKLFSIRILRLLATGCASVLLAVPFGAHATNGLLAYGNGMIAHGIGGAGIANSAEPMSGMDNPALILNQSGFSIGATLFNPNRSADVGTGYVDSESDYFVIPQGGWVTRHNDSLSWGVLVNALGGMNTDYPKELFGTESNVGADLGGMIVAPTVAYAASDRVTVGASLLVGYEMLETEGPAVGTMPGNWDDSAIGYGLRIGIVAEVTEGTSLGFSAQTEIEMDDMDEFCNTLFAAAGSDCDLSMPKIYGLGISSQIADGWKIIADVQEIKWSGVEVLGKVFHWDDQTVYKLGFERSISDDLAIRFGFNQGDSPISDDTVQSTVLAPAVSEEHLTVGFTKTLAGGGVLSAYYARIFENEQTQNAATSQSGQSFPRIKMDQHALGISFAKSL